MTEMQKKDRQDRINLWIDRAKAITEKGYYLFDELFDVRLEKNGEFAGFFDSKKEAIRWAERMLGIG